MSGSLIPNAKQQFLDANGNPLAGGFVYYYIPSTTTFKNTYQNAALTILNTNPIILDSAGECIAYGDGSYRQIVTDVNGNLIWDQPTVTSATSASVTAAIAAALQLVYPVGSIYTSTAATNPNILFGFGTWSAFGAGRVLIGNGGGFSAGATGGSADAIVVSHTHTATSTSASTTTITDPSHAHNINAVNGAEGSDNGLHFLNDSVAVTKTTNSATTGISVSTATTTSTTNASTGVSGTNANLQPYIVVYMWQRTA